MMYNFFRKKITTKKSFHYKTMFKNVITFISKRMSGCFNENISTRYFHSTTFPIWVIRKPSPFTHFLFSFFRCFITNHSKTFTSTSTKLSKTLFNTMRKYKKDIFTNQTNSFYFIVWSKKIALTRAIFSSAFSNFSRPSKEYFLTSFTYSFNLHRNIITKIENLSIIFD